MQMSIFKRSSKSADQINYKRIHKYCCLRLNMINCMQSWWHSLPLVHLFWAYDFITSHLDHSVQPEEQAVDPVLLSSPLAVYLQNPPPPSLFTCFCRCLCVSYNLSVNTFIWVVSACIVPRSKQIITNRKLPSSSRSLQLCFRPLISEFLC